MSTLVVYREVQRFRQPVLWLLVVGTAVVFAMFSLGEAQTLGGRVLCLVTAAAIVLLFGMTRLKTEVTEEGVVVSFPPFHRRQIIPFEDLKYVEHHQYHPATPLGHWGIHLGFDDHRSFNIEGDNGVELVYGDEDRLIVGSQQSMDLVEAIRRMQRLSGSRGTRRV